jgi:hypothetical protein
MENIKNSGNYILSLDISSKCIGVALFEDEGRKGKVKLLTHVSPKVKPEPATKTEELFKKVTIFETEFLYKYKEFGIKRVLIEEPLFQSNNVYTIATLIKFNAMVSRSVYDILGIVPEYISSNDARRYAFPELVSIRKTKKDGTLRTEKDINKSTPVLFGAYDFEDDKKMIIWEHVSELEPQITWLYDKKNKLKKESFDLADAYTVARGYMRMNGHWD